MAGGIVASGRPAQVDAHVDVVIIGAGACGLTAALRARKEGAEVVVVERDPTPTGSTSMSSGFVPAAGTRFQRAIGIDDDSPERLFADIMAKSKGASHAEHARLATRAIGPAIEWLADHAAIEWVVLDDFLYPGHSRHRMHAVPEKTGAALENRLLDAAESAGVVILNPALADRLHVEDNRIGGLEILRPDGSREIFGSEALILACSGFGGNAELVRRFIPEIADGLYYGHAGNKGDAISWGEALGARLEHLSGYQGHGSLAHPHGILISWALMMEGAIQVNVEGKRFSNEHGGYSEQAVHVLNQPGGIAWNIFDERLHAFALSFPDYREAVAAGAVRHAHDVSELARVTGVAETGLEATLEDIDRYAQGRDLDPFGRDFTGKPALVAPYRAVRVTGALFHTQGGLVLDHRARVLTRQGVPFENLFAGGGAACGLSGPEVSGYLSGNGLLSAIAFGHVAGENAARVAAGRRD